MPTLSLNFSSEEYAVSASHPQLVEPVPDDLLPIIADHARYLLQPIRDHVGRAVQILSGYRSPALNTAVGGSPTSQHRRASAADITLPGHSQAFAVRSLFEDLVAGRLVVPAGQVIWYPAKTFIHIALPSARYPEASYHVHWPLHEMEYRRVTSLQELRYLVDDVIPTLADPDE